MGKQDAEDTREGGREPAKPVTSGFDQRAATLLQGRNSSGNASNAASLLDLRQKVNFIFTCLEALCISTGDNELREEIQSYRQRGFRRGR